MHRCSAKLLCMECEYFCIFKALLGHGSAVLRNLKRSEIKQKGCNNNIA